MPLYEYACDACGKRFERIQKFSDPPVDTCPHCGAQQVRKLISAPGFQFKGSGWYVTDYARKSDGAGGSTAAKDSGSSSSSGDSSKESTSSTDAAKDKPAATSDPAAKK